MKREFTFLLTDILAACENTQNFIQGIDYDTFLHDEKTSSAVIRQFEIIGEAAKNIPNSIKNQYTNIPWKDIVGMRDRLIHGYFGVDYYLVWDSIKLKIPELKVSIQKILDDLKEQEDK